VTFTLNNVGSALHNMHVSDADGNFEAAFCTGDGDTPCSEPPRISGGASGEITIDLPAGTYEYRCDFHTSEMVGTLEVQ
jgi:plastocyanin